MNAKSVATESDRISNTIVAFVQGGMAAQRSADEIIAEYHARSAGQRDLGLQLLDGRHECGFPQTPPRDLAVAIRAATAIRSFLEAQSIPVNEHGERALRGMILAAFHEVS